MATTYIIRTNNVDHGTTYTNKARAIKEAELISAAAETRNAGDVVEVVTASRGKVVYSYTNDIDFSVDTVEIQGEEPHNWTPDFSAPGASECYYGCGRDVVAVFVDYVGRTEGICAGHRDRVEGRTYELPTVTPEERQTDAESVSEGVEGESVEPFVFIPGTHALDMGDFKYNRFVGIGESSAVPGSMFTFGLATAISAHPGMGGTGKVNIPCEFGDVITVRTSLGDVRYVVEDNRYSATGPRKGDPILTPYATDTQRCARCETHGDNSMPSAVIHGDYVCGYCVENTESDESDRFPCFKRMGVVTHKGECAQAHGVNGAVCSLEDDETEDEPLADWERDLLEGVTDAGFVETDSVEDVSLSTVSTGTTHHSMDSHGGQWTRFEHVLTVGDVVKSTEHKGLFTVYALIPGLPVVYIDAHDGREPFPAGATTLYAL